MNLTAAEIMRHFENMNEKELEYVDFHKFRYIYLLSKIEKIIDSHKGEEQIKILDIGPAYQTSLIRKYFPNTQVDTLGFSPPSNILRPGETHYKQDLNESDEKWEIENNEYHIIIFCEVIEHLYTRPELCLHKLKTALIKNGRVIIQTPNAVAIHKRVQMLFGFNPYNLLEKSKMGHFREYTAKELKKMLANVGLEVEYTELKNYFNSTTTILNRIYVKSEFIIPYSLRDGITIVGTNRT